MADFNEAISDTTTSSDGPTGLAAYLRANSESIPTTDSLNAIFGQPRSVSDTLSTSDSPLANPGRSYAFPFNIGSHLISISFPFDIEQPPQLYQISLPFDIDGREVLVISFPFSIAGNVNLQISFPFRILSSVPSVGVFIEGLGYVAGVHVFDKAGARIGFLTDFEIADAPSRELSDAGSTRIYVPRNSADAALLQIDRLIAFELTTGGEMWAGNIEPVEEGEGKIEANIPDLISLLTGCTVTISQAYAEPPPAWTVYKAVIDAMNEQKALDAELTWEFDGSGTQLFYGRLEADDEPFNVLQQIADKSHTEFTWRAAVVNDRLVATLVVRDRIEYTGGADLFEGPGGNVANNPRWTRDPATIVNAISLSGLASSIADYLPEWAQWAVESVVPSVEVSVPTGPYRRRVRRDLPVDFTFSDSLMRGIANQVLAVLWSMFRDYLRAYHDTFGRPFHEGWAYEGPPSDIEPFLHTGLGWRTRRRLVELSSQPASEVMQSDSEAQMLAVTYDRVLAEKRVRRYWFSEADGNLYVPLAEIHGRIRRWDSQGGVLTEYTSQFGTDAVHGRTSMDHTNCLVSSYSVTMMHVFRDNSGNEQTDWHTVRRVINLSEDGTLREGLWIEMATPAGPTNTPNFTRPIVGEAPYLRITLIPLSSLPDRGITATTSITTDTAYIGKMYPFEEYRIKDWDPRRDGVGLFTVKRTIVNNAPSTQPRWHIVPFGIGTSNSTQLTTGISETETVIYVDSTFSLPLLGSTWNGYLEISTEPGNEIVLVTNIVGNALTVVRGQRGTAAIIHEGGESVRALDATDTDLFSHLWNNLDWPEGRAYALELLSQLNTPRILIQLRISNEHDEWSTVRIGSIHHLSLTTVGPGGGHEGDVRVVGYAPDLSSGSMELVVEWLG